jgi:hypothetical protein
LPLLSPIAALAGFAQFILIPPKSIAHHGDISAFIAKSLVEIDL